MALRLGTRGSPLALRQAALVAGAIEAEVETIVLRTAGDRGEGGDKRRWVDTIEAALLDGTIDLAVHSAKDLPAELGRRPRDRRLAEARGSARRALRRALDHGAAERRTRGNRQPATACATARAA